MPVFELHPSRLLIAAVLVIGVAAVGALAVAQIPWLLVGVGTAVMTAVVARTLWPGNGRVVALAARTDGRWAVCYADGRRAVGALLSDSVAHPWLCVVVLRDGWRRVAVTVPADGLAPDAHRRLRVRLRWAPKASVRPAVSWSRQSPWPG